MSEGVTSVRPWDAARPLAWLVGFVVKLERATEDEAAESDKGAKGAFCTHTPAPVRG